VRITIDDFGTGHSSLSPLRDLTASILKMDRSFLSDIDADPAIVGAVSELGTPGHGLAHSDAPMIAAARILARTRRSACRWRSRWR
jgi:hypothetical protein